jgi:superfamily II DNA or RNA helicase
MLNHRTAPRTLPDFLKYIDSKEYRGIGETLVKRDGNQDFTPPPVRKEIVSHPLSATEARIYTGLKALLNMLKSRVNDFKARGDTVNTKKFSTYIMGMLGYLRQCLICPMIPITSVALDVADYEQRSELSDMFMQVIRDMHIDDYLKDVNSLCSSRIRAACDKVVENGNERIIIFSCFRTAIDALRVFLPKNRPIFTIEGNDKIEKRGEVIEQFRASPNGILLLTYEIGANGLNLQCASTAILMDFWWNSAKSEQAVARLLRPGQTAKQVNLYYLTANTGMENAIFKLHESKRNMGNEIMVGRMTTTTTKLQIKEIIALINTEDNIQILDKLIR